MTDWSLQLYSARNTPLRQALDIIAAAGYASVEAYASNFENADKFKAGLDATGLSVQSAHVSRQRLGDALDEEFEQGSRFGYRHIVMPYLTPDERPQDVKGWQRLAEELTGYAARCRDAGFVFSYHNHDFEFQPLADGKLPMSVLLDAAPDVQWEIDIAWIVRADVDPLPWVEQYFDRISAVHMKDLAPAGECVDEDGWADVGYGVIDWAILLQRLQQTPARLYAMEHDNPSDLQRFARRSIERANTWQLAGA